MRFDKIKSHAKVNLSLNVLGKRKSKLHNLETLVAFVDLHDQIFIKRINNKNHVVRFSGHFSNKVPKVNTVSNLLNILDKKKKLKNHKYSILIKKNIPQEAGLGGGSMNAASLINYFEKKNKINLTLKEKFDLFSKIGSDVILDIDLADLYKFHVDNKNDVTLVASVKRFTIPYGACELNSDGALKEIHEKPSYELLANVGLYMVQPSLFQHIPKGKHMDMTKLLEDMRKIDKKIGVYPVHDQCWFDVGQWTEYRNTVEKM